MNTVNRSQSKKGRLGIKIDLAKALDKMEWSFVKTVLINFGFHLNFVNWITQCISTPTFSILLNGSPVGFFKGSRVLRHGDPLSSYLFIISMELLSRLIYKVESQNLPKGIKISRNNDCLSHLLFGDGHMILTRATTADAKNSKNTLKML